MLSHSGTDDFQFLGGWMPREHQSISERDPFIGRGPAFGHEAFGESPRCLDVLDIIHELQRLHGSIAALSNRAALFA